MRRRETKANMKGLVFGLCLATVALVMAGPAHAELMSFESDFTSWTGTDANATSPVSSSTGHTPGSNWSVTFDEATGKAAAGWLTQGSIEGTPTTARFYHQIPPGTANARARFSAALPDAWRLNGLQGTSLTVDFRLNCHTGYQGGSGAPIQISYPTIYGMFNAYIRVRCKSGSNSQIIPLNNSRSNAPGVNTNTLSSNLGGEWHSWRVVVTYGEYADYGEGSGLRHWAYWDLFLDGQQLSFTGANGSPVFNGHTYSFRTYIDNVGGVPYLGLGELSSCSYWEFEFDYVNFSADYAPEPLSELHRWSFDTSGDAESWNRYNEEYYPGGPAPSDSIAQQDTYTFIDPPPAGQDQTVFVNLMERDPADWPWDGVNPTEGGALYAQKPGGWGMWLRNGVKAELNLAGDVTAIEFNVSTTLIPPLPDVWVDFYIREPVSPFRWARLRSKRLLIQGSSQTNPWKWSRTRYDVAEFPTMELVVGSKWWEPGPLNNLNTLYAVNFVNTPGTPILLFMDDVRLYGPLPCGLVSPEATQALTVPRYGVADPIIYTFSHTGEGEVSYTVEETDADGNSHDYTWLSLDKAGGGPLASGQSDAVTVTVTDTTMTPGTYTAYITFVDTCDPVNTHIRQVDVTIAGCQVEVFPSAEIARSWIQGPGSSVQDAVFTVRNTGQDGLSYSVVEVVDCPWLSLDKAGGGPLDYGETDAVAATINPAGLATGVHICTLRFTSSCTPAVEYERDVVLSVLDDSSVLQQFDADFSGFTGVNETAESPFDRCDARPTTGNKFGPPEVTGDVTRNSAAIGNDYLTQGSIGDVPTTAKFYNPPGSYTYGRIRFDGNLPFDESYDPAKGMVLAWRMKVGNYAPGRGPVQIMAPAVSGPYTGDVSCYNCYIRLSYGTQVRILDNSGNSYPSIHELVLDTSIANEYHQWTAAVCYDSSTNAAYWKLWLDGTLLLFGGSDGSVVGPAGETYSFRTVATTSSKPYVRLGEWASSTFDRGWNFEFDFVRALSPNVAGSPFWDGEGCPGGCPVPFADADRDGDVDQSDFAAFQRCITGPGDPGGVLDQGNCACFDRNGDNRVDGYDVAHFEACGTGPGVPWTSTPACP